MADSDIVAGFRRDLLVGESKQNAANSESYFQRLASQNNFINLYQAQKESIKINGQYGGGLIVEYSSFDGTIEFPAAAEIVAMSATHEIAGDGGSTEIDYELWRAGSNLGTIFTTKPKIDAAAGDDSYFVKNFLTAEEVKSVSGITVPVLSTSIYQFGDILKPKLTQIQDINADTLKFTTWWRPINP